MGKVDTVGVHSLVSENSSLTFSMYVLYSNKKKNTMIILTGGKKQVNEF